MFPDTPPTPPNEPADDFANPSAQAVIPIIEETLRVHTELVETGRVRVSKRVESIEQQVDVPIIREIVDVQRIPINQVVEQVPLSRQEGDTLILPVVREEVVTSIRLVLVEEVHITRRQEQTIDQQTVALRRETIAVERSDFSTDQPTSPATGTTL